MPSGSSEIGTIATGNPEAKPYIGRFAPSPTGPLHFGSLLAAIASCLEARVRGGQWLVRIEDIDPPREKPGASDEILRALEAYGFEWDGPVTYQSANRGVQEEAVAELLAAGQAYPCGCSRRDLADSPVGPLGTIYPGFCRDGTTADDTAIRVRTTDERIAFADRLQGPQSQRLESDSGDFIILRRDGLIAYQLAVVVDDYLQGITDIVRGIDLMDSTPRQIWLQRLLGYAQPSYLHIPVATNRQGQKLSKSHGAGAVSDDRVTETLVAAFTVLEQAPPDDLAEAPVSEIWRWAVANWAIDRLRGRRELPVGELALANAESPQETTNP